MLPIIPENHIESARVYVDLNKPNAFVIKCFYCCKNFEYWSRYEEHLKLRHSDDILESYKEAKKKWEYPIKLNETISNAEDKFSEEEKDQDTEIVLIDIDRCDTKEVQVKEEEFLDIEEDVEFEENEEEGEEEEDEEEEFISEDEAIINPKPTTNCRQSERTLRKINYQAQSTDTEDAGIYTQKKRRNRINTSQVKSMSCSSAVESENYISNVPNYPFYNMSRTDPAIMYDFIEIIRNHPIHWDQSNPDFELKEKRDESSEQISQELEERWNINISPQIARTSVLKLCRWFEWEYVRSMRDKEYESKHPNYYDKLMEFLPHDHLVPLKCDECSRKFKSSATYLAHQYSAHNGELPYMCMYCGRGFLHQSALRHHENRHTKANCWPCDKCSYSAPSKTDYQVHMIAHSDIRAFECDICNARYKSSTSLAVHKRTHDSPKLQCKYCDKRFYENYRLKRHIKLIHDEGKQARQFKCHACSAKFPSKVLLKVHKDTHDDLSFLENMNNVNVALSNDTNTMVIDGGAASVGDNDDDGLIESLIADCVEETFICTYCSAEFLEEKAYDQHLLLEHS